MHGRMWVIGIALLSVFGCSDRVILGPKGPEEQEASHGQGFDLASSRTIQGRVVWEGTRPIAEEKLIRTVAYAPGILANPIRISTPHVPKIDSKNGGIENVVVFLRGVEPQRPKAWHHAKVRVEFDKGQLAIQQGSERSQVGFVRRGAAIEVINRDDVYHNVHGRGSAFFAMPLLERDRVHHRVMDKAGVVDLSCGASYYWMHAHLFVVEHPYIARTDAGGRFTLDQVPPGSYELVCWLPSWHVQREVRHPETGIIARQIWAPPIEQSRKIHVGDGRTNDIEFRWSRQSFESK